MKWKTPELILIYADNTKGVKGTLAAVETQGVSWHNNFNQTTMDLGMVGFNVTNICNIPSMFTCSPGTMFTAQGSIDVHRISLTLPVGTNVYHFKGISSAAAPS